MDINLKQKKKTRLLSTKVLKYLIFFSILILTFLWFFQVIFLDKYYEAVRTKEIKAASKKIKTELQNISDLTTLDEIAFKEGICIEITNNKTDKIYESVSMKK